MTHTATAHDLITTADVLTTKRDGQRVIGDLLLGTTPEGEKVYIDVTFTRHTGEYQTTDHRTITDMWEVAITGEVRRGVHCVEAGQCIEALDNLTPARGITPEAIATVRAVWERDHLNMMNAGCDHQTPVYTDTPYRRVDLDATPACPETGYRYGSAWLVRDLGPATVADLLDALTVIAAHQRRR